MVQVIRPDTHYGTGDAQLGVGPGCVYWIYIVPTDEEWELHIKDGSDTSGEILLRAIEAEGPSTMLTFNPPLPFELGLFVHAVSRIRFYTIAFDHL